MDADKLEQFETEEKREQAPALQMAASERKEMQQHIRPTFRNSPRESIRIAIGDRSETGAVKAGLDVQSRPMSHTLPKVRSVLKSQYHASLAMLRDAIEHCPPEEWLSTDHKNAFWQVAYHALFFGHLYLQRDEAAFRLWEKHHGGGDGIEGEPYTQSEVLEYWEFCDRMVDDAVDALDLDRTESGFSWYRMSKLEHQFVNIRHIQHHGAQLIDRVRAAADVGIRWVAAR